jgi:hypothetical protein
MDELGNMMGILVSEDEALVSVSTRRSLKDMDQR